MQQALASRGCVVPRAVLLAMSCWPVLVASLLLPLLAVLLLVLLRIGSAQHLLRTLQRCSVPCRLLHCCKCANAAAAAVAVAVVLKRA
jgi:hypothetical protein